MSDTKTEISSVTELLSPKLKLPQLGTETAERVFPVRSVVSFDSAPSSSLPTPSLEKLETSISPFSDAVVEDLGSGQLGSQEKDASKNSNPEFNASRRPNDSRESCQKSEQESKAASAHKEPSAASHTSGDWSKKTVSEERSLNSNLRKGDEDLLDSLQHTLQNGSDVLGTYTTTKGTECSSEDEEKISIQSFGVLLAIAKSDGNFEVQIASSNSEEIIGHSPEKLFGMESFCNLLPASNREKFIDHSNTVSDDQYDVEVFGPEVFSLGILSSDDVLQETWCTMHTSQLDKNYIICEIQPQRAATPESNAPSLVQSENKQLDSTSGAYFGNTNLSNGNDSSTADAGKLLNSISRTLRQLGMAQSLETFVQCSMSILEEYVQFDRTTMYHFDSDHNGVVLGDARSGCISGLPSYDGIQFPESAFSEELKKEYKHKTVSFSYSDIGDTAHLVYRTCPKRLPLDMSNTYLVVAQAPSKPHSTNPVKACLSIQINVFGKLWGLISCQSYSSNQRLHPLKINLCWFIAEAVSSKVERLSYSLPFQLKDPTSSPEGTAGVQATKTPLGDLLSLFGADYAAASILGETKILGRPADSQEVLALLEYMKAKKNDSVCWSTDIASDFPDLTYSRGFHRLAGLFYVPLSGDGTDFIIFFRAGSGDTNREQLPGQLAQSHAEHEAAKPSQKQLWSTAEIGKASILSQLYRTFTDIWQEKEVTLQNNQLMRLLLANSAHEFRTPLNAIINYLEIALDGPLDQETRENISRSHSASRSLVYIINDLLDLTNAENGQRLIKDEVFHLSETLTEATDIFWEEARQKDVNLQVVQHAALPLVLGDQRRVRQVITNLISNAVQHTSSGAVTIESCIVPEPLNPDHISVEVAIHDTGTGMSQETVETLFCELEQVSNKGYMRNPKDHEQASGQSLNTESVLGLGLALVARIVRNMRGQLSLRSEEGKGSCFKIRLEFPLPDDSGQNQATTQKEDMKAGERDETKQNTKPSCLNHKEGDILCECGETSEFRSEEPLINIDVNVKSGESRNLSLSAQSMEEDFLNEQDPCGSSIKQTPEATQSINTSLQTTTTPDTRSKDSEMDWSLHILVAEDDPVNSNIVRKRLEKFGHTVHLTYNGKECLTVYKANPFRFDVVLMDLQVCQPILVSQ